MRDKTGSAPVRLPPQARAGRIVENHRLLLATSGLSPTSNALAPMSRRAHRGAMRIN